MPDLPAPTEVPDLRDVAQLTLGFESHACALLRDGGVRCWGSNSRGQLGDGSLVARLDPVPVAGLSGVAEVTAGAYFTCARMTDGTARCWGDNEFGQLGDGTTTARREPAVVAGLTDVAQLALGFYHACARRTDGTVWCWGRGHLGQLGRGRPEHHRVHPTRVDGVRDATWLAMGQNHSCALQADGAAYCWGNNGSGQLGDGTREDRARPVRVAWGGS